MCYVTPNGVRSSYNLCAYDDIPNLLTAKVLNVAYAPKDLLKKAKFR